MGLARYVVEAVVLEGRSYREVSRAHGVSKSWVAKVVGRFREGGYEAIAPRRQGSAGAGVEDQPELRQASGDAGMTSITRNTTSRGAPNWTVLEKMSAGRWACAPSQQAPREASTGGLSQARAPMMRSIAPTLVG